ncbi:hypothetical protein B5P46_11900 [Rhizobium leguminosarum]|uniref:Transmembrane protein n=1 Tax=Rhizobium leguminosarum TaxID=384 RepID=A0A4Q1UE45_RHILE|nr:hypothetical protein [Rhizobium leguminosarum]RXT29377.1 hypothetical protein B5P46_11900 [Rhizobium leguminosarum]
MPLKTLPDIVPAPAKMLLDFIRSIEAPRGYGTIYGNNQDKLPVPLTSMTLDQVIAAGSGWSKKFGSSAAGGLQFMRLTLQQIKKETGISGDLVFSAGLQDRLGYYLLLGRGYADFIEGKLGVVAFGKALAQEWASFPVLADTRGQKRPVKRGDTYYAGDGINKVLLKPEKVEAKLQDVLELAGAVKARQQKTKATSAALVAAVNDNPPPIAPAPAKPKPIRKSGRFWTWAGTGGISLTTIVEKLGFFQLDYRVQIALLVVVVGFAVYAIATMTPIRNALGLKSK